MRRPFVIGPARSIGSATIGTLVGNVLSLALPFIITAWFRSPDQTDAYFYALGIILFLNVTISVAVESATTPYVAQILRDPGAHAHDTADRFIRRVRVQASFVCLACCATGIALVQLVILPQSSFDEIQSHLVRNTLATLAPLPVIVTWNSVLAGAAYARGSFGIPTASVGLRTLFALLVGLLFHAELGTVAVAIGLVLGELVRLVVLEADSLRSRRRTSGAARSSAARNVRAVREFAAPGQGFWQTATPQALSMSTSGLSPIVDRTIAIGLGGGAVTMFELSQRLVYTPIFLLLSGVGLVLGARWAHQVASDDTKALKGEYLRLERVVFILGMLVLATLVPLVFMSRPLLSAAFSIEDPTVFAWTFTAAASGIPFALASQVSVRLLLAGRQTASMPYLTGCVLGINLGLDVLFSRSCGIVGVAMASAVVNVFNACAYRVVARRWLKSRAVRTVDHDFAPDDKAITTKPAPL